MINVKDFGAKGDKSQDDYGAITNAISAATNSSGASDRTVYFPPGEYLIKKPLVVNSPDILLCGSPARTSFLVPHFGSGPTILLASPRQPFKTLPSLVPGPRPGNAMSTERDNYLLTSDTPTMDLNGLTEFTVECFAKSSKDPGPGRANTLVSSQGRLLTTEPIFKFAFKLFTYETQIRAWITLANGNYHELCSPSNLWTSGTVHHLALVISAGTATLYYDGSAVASYTEPNLHIRQEPYEEVIIGGGQSEFPYQLDGFADGMDALDSVRISSIARYQAPFVNNAPRQKFTYDQNTLLLLNFDNDKIDANFVVAETNAAPNGSFAFLTLQQGDRSNGRIPQISNVSVQDLYINCNDGASGIYCLGTINSCIQNVWIEAARHGMYLSNVYSSFLSRLWIDASYRIGFLIAGQAEELTVQHLSINGGVYSAVLAGPVGGAFTNVQFAPRAQTIASLVYKGGDVSIYGFQVDDEGGVGGMANFIVGDFSSLTLHGGEFASTTTRPHLLVSGSDLVRYPDHSFGKLSIYGTVFFGKDVAQLVKVINPRPNLVSIFGIVNPDVRPITESSTAFSVDVLRRTNCGSCHIIGFKKTYKVTFPAPELDNSYFVSACVSKIEGTPAAGATRVYVTEKSKEGFQLNLEAAPGAPHAEVTIDWLLVR